MKTYLISGLVALLVALGVVVLTPNPVQKIIETKIGSAASNDLAVPYFRFGGVLRYANSMTMNTATTTNCSIQSPSATSTLTNFSARLDTGTSTTPTFFVTQNSSIATTTANGQTVATQIFTGAGVANEIGRLINLVATSTSSGVAPLWIFPPNSYVNFSMAGGIGTFSPTGECKASWLVN